MKIYVTGATADKKLFGLYDYISKELSKLGHKVKTPLDTIEFCKTHNNKERIERAIKEITDTDFIISEISSPSSGQGFELGFLYARHFKNVVLITSDFSKASGMLTGAFGKPILYNYNQLSNLLNKILDRFINNQN